MKWSVIISNNCYVPELGYTEIKKYWENLKILWGDCADAEPLPFGTDPKQHAPQQVVENMTIPPEDIPPTAATHQHPHQNTMPTQKTTSNLNNLTKTNHK